MQDLGPNQTLFLTSLDKYKQTRHALEKSGAFCVLGVGCDLFCKPEQRYEYADGAASYDGCSTAAPQVVVQSLALRDECGGTGEGEDRTSLMIMNDSLGLTFSQIRDIILADPSKFFTEPR